MAKQVADVPGRLRLKQVRLLGNRKSQQQVTRLENRLRKSLSGQMLGQKRWDTVPAVLRQLFVGHGAEERDGPVLEQVKRLTAENDELHAIGRVVLLVKGEKLVAHIDTTRLWLGLEDIEAAGIEIVVRVFLIG